jgi:hypothetical protein
MSTINMRLDNWFPIFGQSNSKVLFASNQLKP